MRAAAAAAALAGLALAACSGGDEASSPTPAPPAPPGVQEISQDELALMVLPRSELGAAAAGLEVNAASSGSSDNAAAAESSIDPADTGAELAAAGRVGGYELDYVDPELTSLTGAAGVYEFGTRVHLFRDAAAASTFLAKQEDDFRRLDGAERTDGIRLEGVTTFPVDTLGDEAFGVTAAIVFAGVGTSGTFVAFRIGRLVGTSGLLRGAAQDDVEIVERAARALERRLRAVLAGEIAGPPEPIPGGPRDDGAPPPGEVDVAAMALDPADLPGTTVTDERYVQGEATVATFRRVFGVEGVRVGADRLVALESEIRLFDSAVEASFALQSLEETFAEDANAVLRSALAREGTAPLALRIAPISGFRVGDATLAFDAALRTATGERRGAVVFVQAGRALGSLLAVRAGTGPDPAELAPLVGRLLLRMEAGFRR